MIKEYLEDRARKKALLSLLRELKKYQEKIDKSDSDVFINLFNSGLFINLKTAGGKILDIASKILEKEHNKRNKTA